MFDKLSRSWELIKESWGVLRKNPQLAIFPVVSGIAMLFVCASFLVPLGFSMAGQPEGEGFTPLGYVLLGCFYFVSYFVIIFFNAGLVSCAYACLRGESPTFGDGMRAAMNKLGPILVWTLISMTVGVVLNAIRDRAGFLGNIIAGFLGLAWNLVVYFVVPLIVLENESPISAIKRSGQMLKKTWGENIVGNAGIGLVFGFISIGCIAPAIVGLVSGVVPLMIVGVAVTAVLLLAMGIISAALSGVYQTALFEYANTGQAPSEFRSTYIQDAFTPNRKK